MKNVLKKVKLLGAVVAMGGMLSLCGPSTALETKAAPQSCPHYTIHYCVSQVPRCEVAGSWYTYCGCCGKIFSGGWISHTGHSYVYYNRYLYKCSSCGQFKPMY